MNRISTFMQACLSGIVGDALDIVALELGITKAEMAEAVEQLFARDRTGEGAWPERYYAWLSAHYCYMRHFDREALTATCAQVARQYAA